MYYIYFKWIEKFFNIDFLFYTLKLLQYIYQKILSKNTDKKHRNIC
jgi:hypothetical protein